MGYREKFGAFEEEDPSEFPAGTARSTDRPTFRTLRETLRLFLTDPSLRLSAPRRKGRANLCCIGPLMDSDGIIKDSHRPAIPR
jgi:hypothetical protein